VTAAVRYVQRPDLWADSDARSAEVWPEYNLHGDVLNRHWGRLFERFPEFQFALVGDGDVVLAEGHTAPCRWDGTPAGLGNGIDETLVAALDTSAAPSALCALAAEILPAYQGRGLATALLDAMAAIAREHGLSHLIAPVRPSLKERYPLTPIERYVAWTRADGEPFDPWIRVHTRRGGVVLRPIPESMRITGSVAEWEQWTDMAFPEDGDYVFPRGLAPLTVARGQGLYWEPNVWIVHTVS
jgi:GNAT superfamily N-acetyltransferase